MVLITRGKDIYGKRGTLLKIENGLIWVEGINRGLKPSQVEFGDEDMELIKSSKEIMSQYDIRPKYQGRHIMMNKLSKV